MSYIHSNANRIYAAVEALYGQVAPVSPLNRFAAFRVHAQQILEPVHRRDKTGSRTNMGGSILKTSTQFEVETYLVSSNETIAPAYGALLQGACGAPPKITQELSIQSALGTQLQTIQEHNLNSGSAIYFGGEIRFVTEVLDSQTFSINALFAVQPPSGAILSPTITYRLATSPPSLSIYDYWDPATAVNRIISGAVIDSMTIHIDGPYHELIFAGPAADLMDSANVGSSNILASFPTEPPVSSMKYSVVPGNLGKVLIGNPASTFLTVTQASLTLRNNISLRNREVGSARPSAASFGKREILSTLHLLAMDDAQTVGLYAAAKQGAPVPLMLQMGKQQGQAMALYMPAVVPQIPVYEDAEPRLAWQFQKNIAQGTVDDELAVAFA